ncbi:tRNA glutamyl-Q(34) synthetase GluQRS [Brevibacterium sp. 5221]|uniref:tRNA glutamyl-Q(34) synthetase GluQRS n=1 Tax=Brevibacterium rongguiense TaxID=2695267 RepID=A0A6N9H600_9MICO|nr:tRNA glutamyl-Q(34) synthetase GluQRS [Brevibacterium rongguiense]MYM19032.1 tRNA glutamyl-Q(34) synthetase GluQRS [Brevibacterium rongguiense]
MDTTTVFGPIEGPPPAAHGAGRFAPSPSGDLHLGNLRTLVLAALFARASGRAFRWRIEDLDRVRAGSAESQLADAAELGIDWDAPLVVQSERTAAYEAALAQLTERGEVFECYCSRKDIQAAPTAPHAPPGAYPGTCRDLDEDERRTARAALAEAGRQPALRLRSSLREARAHDALLGTLTAPLDDFVLRRGDGVFAYNLTSVVDDGAAGIDQVVRGDDLASSAPRQADLAACLGIEPPAYAHVPLVLSASGARLAKRDGAVTLQELRALGFDVWGWIGRSSGFGAWGSFAEALGEFDPARLVREPAVFIPPE